MQEDPAKRNEDTSGTPGSQEEEAAAASGETPRPAAAAPQPPAAPSTPEDGGDDEEDEGSGEGMAIPGVLPKQGVVEGEHEMTPEERAILKDLEESLPEDAREGHGEAEPAGVGAPAATPAAVQSGMQAAPAPATTQGAEAARPPRKPLFAWWLTALLYAGIGAWALYNGVTDEGTQTWWRVVVSGVGVYLLWGAWESVRDRNKWKEPVASAAAEPKQPEQPQSPGT